MLPFSCRHGNIDVFLVPGEEMFERYGAFRFDRTGEDVELGTAGSH